MRKLLGLLAAVLVLAPAAGAVDVIINTTGTVGGITAQPTASDQVLVSDSTTSGTWQPLPNCLDTAGQHLNYNIATNQWSCGTTGAAGGSPAFNAITAGTNTTAAMVVGTGASLAPTGTGTITATGLSTPLSVTSGGHGAAPGADDQVFVSSSTSAGAWQTLPNCLDTAGQHLNYNIATNQWLCGTSGGGGGGGITGATNHGIVVATTATTGTSLGVATNGQIPIGSTGADPVLAVPQGTTSQIRVTTGPGSLVFDFPPGGVTLPGTTTGTFSGTHTGNLAGGTNLPLTTGVTGLLPVANGGHGAAPGADDQVFVSDSTTAGTWRPLPNCPDSGGNHLNYNIATNAWICGTTAGTVASVAFSAITGGAANTTAAMVVGTGGSLAPTGTGTITATGLSTPLVVASGGHGSAPGGGDQVFVSDSTTAGTWRTLPNCPDTVGQHLNYDLTTNLWSCGTTGAATAGDVTSVGDCLSGACDAVGNLIVKPIVKPYSGSPINITLGDTRFASLGTITAPVTFNAPTGTVYDREVLRIELCSATPQALTWNAVFRSIHGMPLPVSSTGLNTCDLFAYERNTTAGTWDIIASTQITIKGTISLPVVGASQPTTNPAIIDRSENNNRLRFDAATSECAWWNFRMRPDYAGNLVAKVPYSMTSGTSGSFTVEIAVRAITPGDATDSNISTYATINTCSKIVPATAGFLDEISCPLTNNDNVAPGDLTRVRICRNISGAAAGDAEILNEVTLEYQRN